MLLKSKKFLSVFLVLMFILPQIVFAIPLSGFGKVASCGLMNSLIQQTISQLVNMGTSLMYSAINAGLKYITFGLVSLPEKVEVLNPDMRAIPSKELIKDPIARCIARQVLDSMNEGILKITRTGGRNGGPSFVTNWRNFILEAQYRGEDIFKGMLASSNLCNYFGQSLKKNFGAERKINLSSIRTRVGDLQSFQTKIRCTLPPNFDIENYKNNFSENGGWETFSRLVEPQNNFFGAYLMSLEELEKQRSLEERTDIYQTQGHGFTSKQSCKLKGPNGRCLIYNDIETPADIIKELSAEALKTELNWVVGTDELNELVSNMFKTLINRLSNLSGSKGLSETADSLETDPGFYEGVSPFPPQFPPVCGNGSCETGESVLSCPQDCELQINVNVDIPNLPDVQNP
jgi:hypothetical protein